MSRDEAFEILAALGAGEATRAVALSELDSLHRGASGGLVLSAGHRHVARRAYRRAGFRATYVHLPWDTRPRQCWVWP